MGESKKSHSPRIHGGNVSKYVIVQDRIETDKDGVPQVKEVLLAHPDTEKNTKHRLFKWRTILEMENLRIREATRADNPRRRKKK
tara:strand:+ start:25 stop:279 length:255 start_codon:yes stop_codon:yes gene_type:complete